MTPPFFPSHPRRGAAGGGQEPPGVVEVGEEAGAERGMDVAARHGDYPCEHAAARLVDGPRVGPPARREPELAGEPFPSPRAPPPPLPPHRDRGDNRRLNLRIA